MNRLLRRGLDRGYLSVEDELRSPRGRLDSDRLVKTQTRHRGTVYCEFDELSHGVLHNQVLKATALDLARHPAISTELSNELKLLVRRLASVSDIEVRPAIFRRIQLFRNNSQYAPLMRLCEFVCRWQQPQERGIGKRFYDILRDEIRMSQVFQEFLKNFYYYEQNSLQGPAGRHAVARAKRGGRYKLISDNENRCYTSIKYSNDRP